MTSISHAALVDAEVLVLLSSWLEQNSPTAALPPPTGDRTRVSGSGDTYRLRVLTNLE